MQSFIGLEFLCQIAPDRFGTRAFVLKFARDDAITTIRIGFADSQSGADVVITHMTTLPDAEKGKGHGSKAIQKLLEWAHSQNFSNVQAVQVQTASESFWTKNGFKKLGNVTNDFRFEAVDSPAS